MVSLYSLTFGPGTPTGTNIVSKLEAFLATLKASAGGGLTNYKHHFGPSVFVRHRGLSDTMVPL